MSQSPKTPQHTRDSTSELLSPDTNPNLYTCNICFEVFQGAINRCSSCSHFICTQCYCRIVSHEQWKVHEKRRRKKQLEDDSKNCKGVVRGLLARVSMSAANVSANGNRKHSRRRDAHRGSVYSTSSTSSGPKCPYCNDTAWHVSIAPRTEEEMQLMIAEHRRVEELQEEVRVRELIESEEKYKKRIESGEIARLEHERLQEQERREKQKSQRREERRRRRRSAASQGTHERHHRHNSNRRNSAGLSSLTDLIPEEILVRYRHDSDALERYLTEKAIEESLSETRQQRMAAVDSSSVFPLSEDGSSNDRSNGTEAIFPTLSSMVIAQRTTPLRRRSQHDNVDLTEVSLSVDDDYEASVVNNGALFANNDNPFAINNGSASNEDGPQGEVSAKELARSQNREDLFGSSEEYDEELAMALAMSLSLQQESEEAAPTSSEQNGFHSAHTVVHVDDAAVEVGRVVTTTTTTAAHPSLESSVGNLEDALEIPTPTEQVSSIVELILGAVVQSQNKD